MRTYIIDDYIITKDGKIINKHNGHILKPQKNNKGYGRVSIGGKTMFVHRLVAEKYLSNPNNYSQVNHKDGNKENNSVENLEWVNNLQNRIHATKNNLIVYGEKCPWAKLTENEVREIRKDKNMSNSSLAKKYNVSRATIRDIKMNKTWKRVK